MKSINIFPVILFTIFTSCGQKTAIDPAKTAGISSIVAIPVSDNPVEKKDQKIIPSLPLNYSADRYFNATANDFSPEALKGKVVLLDLWDLSCINCIHTLPSIKSWAEKYKNKGLVIIGVHSPEFESEKSTEKLRAAIEKFQITYPVIADNEFAIWNSLSNEYWPATYLYDKNGILRTMHYGEGGYKEFEAFIQKLLYERDSSVILPALSGKE